MPRVVQNMAVASDEKLDNMMAAMLSPEGTRYLVICRECRKVWPYKRDCKTTRAARDGRARCPKCDSELVLAHDGKEDGHD